MYLNDFNTENIFFVFKFVPSVCIVFKFIVTFLDFSYKCSKLNIELNTKLFIIAESKQKEESMKKCQQLFFSIADRSVNF